MTPTSLRRLTKILGYEIFDQAIEAPLDEQRDPGGFRSRH
jgi:hypothetical protein